MAIKYSSIHAHPQYMLEVFGPWQGQLCFQILFQMSNNETVVQNYEFRPYYEYIAAHNYLLSS
jgi:hypothetical protein